MSELTQNKYKQGDLVYFVGLDNRCQWSVFGTTVQRVYRQPGGVWIYDLNASPFMVRRDEQGIYKNYEDAKMQALLNNEYNKISPKRGGRKTSCDKTSYKMRPSLF